LTGGELNRIRRSFHNGLHSLCHVLDVAGLRK
jgi:hypothetical protein